MGRAVHSEARPGWALITPIRSVPSVALVEVAAFQQVWQPIILLDPEVELQVVLDDLRRHVALGPRVVGEGENDKVRVGRVEGTIASVLRHEPDEPRMEWQSTLAVSRPELRRAGLAGDLDGEFDEVVGVPDEDRVPRRITHRLQRARGHVHGVKDLRLEWAH